MIGRIGDDIRHPALTRCQGCAASTLDCEATMDEDAQHCCGCCTHIHDMGTLARYGLLER